jgi:hypothetical protein
MVTINKYRPQGGHGAQHGVFCPYFRVCPIGLSASTPFSSFDNSFFGVFAFASRPLVVACFELAGDAVSIMDVAAAVAARVCSDFIAAAVREDVHHKRWLECWCRSILIFCGFDLEM